MPSTPVTPTIAGHRHLPLQSGSVNLLNRCLTLLLSVCFALSSSVASIAHAQSNPLPSNSAANNPTISSSTVDAEPPIIELEEIPEGVAGQGQVFTALVADNMTLKDVKLYHRFSGSQSFDSIEMQPLSNSDYYTVTIQTTAGDNRSIEYYIQARDQGGNRVVKGFAFDPLVRNLIPAPAPIQTPVTEPVAQGTQSGGIKLWQIVVGVLAVGAIAAAASSSGGGGDSGSSTDLVPLNLTINNPTTP